MIGFSPGMLATNLLFQPVALDQLTTMVVLWLALRLALGRGSWPLLGVAAGIGLETKYTLAVVLVLLDRDVPRLAPRRPALVGLPAGRGHRGRRCSSRTSSGRRATAGRACTGSSTRRRARSDETRPQFIVERDPAHGGRRSRSPSPESCRSSAIARCARSAGRSSAPSSRTSCSAASRTTRCRCCVFALAAGAIPLDRWATRRRLRLAGAVFVGDRPSGPADRAAGAAAAHGRPSTGSSRRAATISRRSAGPRTCAWWSGTRRART